MSTNSPVHKTYNSILDKHCLSTLPFKMLDNRDQFHFVLLVLISNISITVLGSLAHCLLCCTTWNFPLLDKSKMATRGPKWLKGSGKRFNPESLDLSTASMKKVDNRGKIWGIDFAEFYWSPSTI